MKKVIVFGAYGELGTFLCPLLETNGFKVLRQGRSQSAEIKLDPCYLESFGEKLEEEKPDYVINLIANTNVDECERSPITAFKSNVKSIENICKKIKPLKSCHLIHISTDHVYGGKGPHMEEEAAPENVYALSKYSGEYPAINIGGTVLRINYVGKGLTGKKVTFSDWAILNLKRRSKITLFDDILFNPLDRETLSLSIIMALNKKTPGVFNLGSKGGISKASFILELGSMVGLSLENCEIGKSIDINSAVKRPKDMRMIVDKFERTFNYNLPDLKRVIKKVALEYQNA